MSIKVMQMDICDGCADLDLKTEHHFSDNQLLYTQVFCKNYYICKRAYEAGKKESICKHGTWKKIAFERFICSECGAYIRGDEQILINNENYCYKCGARMDGDENDSKNESDKDISDNAYLSKRSNIPTPNKKPPMPPVNPPKAL